MPTVYLTKEQERQARTTKILKTGSWNKTQTKKLLQKR